MKTMSEIPHYKLMDENNFKRTEKFRFSSWVILSLKITQLYRLYRLKLPPFLLYNLQKEVWYSWSTKKSSKGTVSSALNGRYKYLCHWRKNPLWISTSASWAKSVMS